MLHHWEWAIGWGNRVAWCEANSLEAERLAACALQQGHLRWWAHYAQWAIHFSYR